MKSGQSSTIYGLIQGTEMWAQGSTRSGKVSLRAFAEPPKIRRVGEARRGPVQPTRRLLSRARRTRLLKSQNFGEVLFNSSGPSAVKAPRPNPLPSFPEKKDFRCCAITLQIHNNKGRGETLGTHKTSSLTNPWSKKMSQTANIKQFDKTTLITATKLKARGWTDALIHDLLGPCLT